jgi:hypothetical protein
MSHKNRLSFALSPDEGQAMTRMMGPSMIESSERFLFWFFALISGRIFALAFGYGQVRVLDDQEFFRSEIECYPARV